jgi:oligopeptide/dipeptide ABC transporter ATP-binding protein
MTEPLLEVADLSVTFESAEGPVRAVRGLSFSLAEGEALAIVGESGSGKSVSMLGLLGLLRSAQVTGSARHRGRELIGMSENELREVRGARLAMVFQDPMTSLNPVLTIGSQLSKVMRAHDRRLSKADARQRAIGLLDLVAIPQAATRVDTYPHEMSGGMRQRVMIAMAMANDPDVLIADEPTTALDVTVQAQILDVLDRLREEKNLALILITHDLGVVAGTADRVAVMYAGRIVERGPVRELFADPGHPYTQGLLGCLPRLDARHELVDAIPGTPPSPTALPPGCPFHPRCPLAVDACRTREPVLLRLRATDVACSVVTGPHPPPAAEQRAETATGAETASGAAPATGAQR